MLSVTSGVRMALLTRVVLATLLLLPPLALTKPSPATSTNEPALTTPQPALNKPLPPINSPKPTFRIEPSLKTTEQAPKIPKQSLKIPEPALESPGAALESPEQSLKIPEPSLRLEPAFQSPEVALKSPEPAPSLELAPESPDQALTRWTCNKEDKRRDREVIKGYFRGYRLDSDEDDGGGDRDRKRDDGGGSDRGNDESDTEGGGSSDDDDGNDDSAGKIEDGNIYDNGSESDDDDGGGDNDDDGSGDGYGKRGNGDGYDGVISDGENDGDDGTNDGSDGAGGGGKGNMARIQETRPTHLENLSQNPMNSLKSSKNISIYPMKKSLEISEPKNSKKRMISSSRKTRIKAKTETEERETKWPGYRRTLFTDTENWSEKVSYDLKSSENSLIDPKNYFLTIIGQEKSRKRIFPSDEENGIDAKAKNGDTKVSAKKEMLITENWSGKLINDFKSSRYNLIDPKNDFLMILEPEMKPQRLRRSEEEVWIRHKEEFKPTCSVPPSCSARSSTPKPGGRYPCYCDDLCHLNHDCCFDHYPTPTPTPTPTPPPVFCRSLMPIIQRPYASQRMILLVDRCPDGTSRHLSDKCSRNVDPDSYSYLLDIPVFATRNGFGYSNIYCARCHHEKALQNFTMNITCAKNITSSVHLSTMIYHPGELRWSTPGLGRRNSATLKTQEQSCILDVNFPTDLGRSCEEDLIDNCSKHVSNETKTWCSLYNYYVQVGNKVYKNWDCAVCSGEQEDNIGCLSVLKMFTRISSLPPPPSFIDLFVVDGDCEENQVWDVLYRRCETVSCGSLFSLQDGRCVRENITVESGRSYLNDSCYTWTYKREYSVEFPNKSVYINHTQLMYDFGEYEFNNSLITVCRTEGQWTPVMNIISTVLISISLVCLALHMAIFLALPKRRNIPSMNLFSLTLSLFIVEFLFMIFFHFNSNHTACVIIAVVLYYFLSAAFLWMNVMSIDICRTFHSHTYKTKSRKIFIQYSVYAWSVPFVGVVVATLVDQFSPPDSLLTPQFGTNVCWFNNKWGLMTFFTFPSSLVILANMVLYGISVYSIYKQMKSGELASISVRKNSSSSMSQSTSSRGFREKNEERDSFLKPSIAMRDTFLKPSNSTKQKDGKEIRIGGESESPKSTERFRERLQRRLHAQKKQRVRLVLYCKLAVTLGSTWVFAFISMHTHSIIFEYLFIAFNGLQGTFIFFSFDVKRKVWEELQQRIMGRDRIVRGLSASSGCNAKSTSLLGSSQGAYRYRWSSNRRQDGSYKYSMASHNKSDSLVLEERESSGV